LMTRRWPFLKLLQTEGRTGRQTDWHGGNNRRIFLQIFFAKAPKLVEFKAVDYNKDVLVTVQSAMNIVLFSYFLRNSTQERNKFNMSKCSNKLV
jgi:hypothetical protein